MDVLFTGNLALVSEALFQGISSECRCVIFGENERLNIKKKNVVAYQKNRGQDEIGEVFAAFDFETVLYFSYALDGAQKVFDELEKLETALSLCSKYKVKNFIYITGNDLSFERACEQKTSRYILLQACEQLCETYSDNCEIVMQILKIPYLYQMAGGDCQLWRWIKEVHTQGKVVFPGTKEHKTDFLSEEDLGELISRMLDEPSQTGCHILYLSGENGMTFAEIGALLKQNFPELEVVYKNAEECVPVCRKDAAARAEYGWYPRHLLAEDVIEWTKSYGAEKKKQRLMYERRQNRREIKEKIRVVIELAVVFAAAELLNYWTKGNALIHFIDFRLVYVVLMGTMNGMGAGVIAAVLSCIGYVFSNISGMQWQIVFYNVWNWLPFACYFLLGAVSGYTRDKHDDEVVYAREEYAILEQKYTFLNGLYLKVLESKEEFNSQIIGYKDSFGKMYSVVKKLDSTLPERVFYEAVNVLEEVLGNTYVAIYSTDQNGAYARLNVCSRRCSGELEKSVKIAEFPIMMESLKSNITFVNYEALPGYPAYATPIFRNKALVGMILLMHADYRQMNIEFSNKFRIMTDLIRDSLIRAMDYYDRTGYAQEDVKILCAEKFREILAVKHQMKQRRYLDYALLLIHRNGRSVKELSDIIGKLVRSNDVLGFGEKGELYLLLSQTNRDDIDIVAERMRKKAISFEVVTG